MSVANLDSEAGGQQRLTPGVAGRGRTKKSKILVGPRPPRGKKSSRPSFPPSLGTLVRPNSSDRRRWSEVPGSTPGGRKLFCSPNLMGVCHQIEHFPFCGCPPHDANQIETSKKRPHNNTRCGTAKSGQFDGNLPSNGAHQFLWMTSARC